MIENYINKIESNPKSFCHLDGDHLREWQEDLVFYWSGESLKAEYALVDADRTPEYTKNPEINEDGKFSSFSKVKSPIIFDKRNLECLTDNINLSFFLGTNTVNGYYTIYLKAKPDFKIEAGDYSFLLQIDGETEKQITLNLPENASFTYVRDLLSFEIDPKKYGVEIDFDQTTEDIVAIKAMATGKIFRLVNGTEGIDLLTKIETAKISYGTLPSIDYFDIIKLEGENSSLKIAHTKETEKGIYLSKLRFTYTVNGIQKTTSVEWNNDGLDLDHVEVDIDSSVMYIFINGILSKVVLISPIVRKAEPTVLTINGSENDYYSIEELIIKDRLQHKENFEVPISQLTKYDNTRPYIDYYFNGKNLIGDSVKDLIIDCSNKISMNLNYGGNFYHYHNGWRSSDGSFDESTDSYTFADYLKDFTFNGTEEVFIRAYFESDGNDPQYIKRLQISLDTDSIYGDESKTAAILVGIPTFEPDEEGKEQVIDLNGKDLIIKTDLGTTKIIFPKDMTLDETVKFIEESFPEGIVKVQKDSQHRLVLVSETNGDKAFIKVSGDAADTLFGNQKSAQGTDQDKNTLDKDYKDFIEAIKKYASNDLIPIEIDDDQIRMYLQEAINLYKKYRNDEINTYSIQLKGNETIGYEIPPVIEDWHDITDILFRPLFPLGFYTGSFDNNAEDIVELSLLNAMSGVDYSSFYGKGFQTDYYISLMNISSMEQILGLTPSWEVLNNRLFIYPNNISKYTSVTIKYKAPIDPQKALRDNMIQKFVAGRIRQAQGEIRGQYGSQLSSGGLAMTFNADAMYERGKALVDEAIEEMKKEQTVLGFIMG